MFSTFRIILTIPKNCKKLFRIYRKGSYLMTWHNLIGRLRFSVLTWYEIVVHQFSRVSVKEVKKFWTCYTNNDSDLFVLFRYVICGFSTIYVASVLFNNSFVTDSNSLFNPFCRYYKIFNIQILFTIELYGLCNYFSVYCYLVVCFYLSSYICYLIIFVCSSHGNIKLLNYNTWLYSNQRFFFFLYNWL